MDTAKIPSQRSTINARLRKPGDAIGFGDMPATEKLRPAGHAKIDLAVRWVEKKKDGIYIQSRYGTLRLSPLCSSIVRVTFVKGGVIGPGEHPLITLKKAESSWMYKNASQAIELMTDELYLQVEKAGGAIRYMTRDKKRLLLAERKGECRQLETGTGLERGMVIKMRTWLYLDWAKGENIYGIGPNGKKRIKLRGTARYISYGAVPLGTICARYGLAAYPQMVTSLFGMTDHATDYKPVSMLAAMFGDYLRYSAWLLLFVMYMVFGLLMFFAAKKLERNHTLSKKIAIVLEIFYSFGFLIVLRFCYGRGMFGVDYTDNFSMYKWVTVFLLIAAGLCVWCLADKKCSREYKLWSSRRCFCW